MKQIIKQAYKQEFVTNFIWHVSFKGRVFIMLTCDMHYSEC